MSENIYENPFLCESIAEVTEKCSDKSALDFLKKNGNSTYETCEYNYPLGKIEEALKICSQLEFNYYSYAGSRDMGTHVICWEFEDITDEQLKELKEFFEQDDDSQPHGSYCLAYGTIWHFIPHFN